MTEDSPREWDTEPPSSLDRLLRRIDAHPSLPSIAKPSVRALGPPTALADEGESVREPVADVVVTPARIYVTLELPGISRETLEVTAEDRHLTIHALAANGKVFHKEMKLAGPIQSDAVTATYRNGVLDVTLPRQRGHQVRVKKGE
jgi:HSP20 family molecular chaperone IbpA